MLERCHARRQSTFATVAACKRYLDGISAEYEPDATLDDLQLQIVSTQKRQRTQDMGKIADETDIVAAMSVEQYAQYVNDISLGKIANPKPKHVKLWITLIDTPVTVRRCGMGGDFFSVPKVPPCKKIVAGDFCDTCQNPYVLEDMYHDYFFSVTLQDMENDKAFLNAKVASKGGTRVPMPPARSDACAPVTLAPCAPHAASPSRAASDTRA